MEELLIEEKAKRYDEAIEKLRSLHDDYDTVSTLIDVKEELENIFPELAESEDERIRKALMQNLKERFGTKGNMGEGLDMPDVLAWLEKQGEQKSIVEMKSPEESLGIDSDTYNKIVDECIYGEQKPADKVEPKFKVGQTIKKEGFNLGFPIVKIENGFYYNDMGDNFPFTDQDNWELVEQKPAEWSDEDEKIINKLMAVVELYYGIGNDSEKEKCLSWLKSLRPQNHWKPSELQIEALESATANCAYSEYQDCLRELIEQLKKLKV